jgi:hypothetical protein
MNYWRRLMNATDTIESTSGLQSCFEMNKTMSTVDTIVQGSDFMEIVYTVMLLSGIIITFWGNKIVKPVIFVAGTTFGAIVGTYGAMTYSNWFQISCNSLYIIASVTGMIGASLTMSVYKLANVILGASLGSSAGYFVYNLGLDKVKLGEFLSHDWMYWICVGIPALVCAYICVNKNRELLMILTPFPGSLMFLYAVDNLLVSNVSGSSAFSKLEWNMDNNSQYIYAGIWLLLSLCGMAVQKRGYLVASYYGDEHPYTKYDGDEDT